MINHLLSFEISIRHVVSNDVVNRMSLINVTVHLITNKQMIFDLKFIFNR